MHACRVEFVLANLDEKRCDPDADEERIAVESVEDVPLSVNLASVDLVEEGHHDERVEDDGEMLRGTLRLRRHCVSAAVDVEQVFTCPHKTPDLPVLRFYIAHL